MFQNSFLVSPKATPRTLRIDATDKTIKKLFSYLGVYGSCASKAYPIANSKRPSAISVTSKYPVIHKINCLQFHSCYQSRISSFPHFVSSFSFTRMTMISQLTYAESSWRPVCSWTSGSGWRKTRAGGLRWSPEDKSEREERNLKKEKKKRSQVFIRQPRVILKRT